MAQGTHVGTKARVDAATRARTGTASRVVSRPAGLAGASSRAATPCLVKEPIADIRRTCAAVALSAFRPLLLPIALGINEELTLSPAKKASF